MQRARRLVLGFILTLLPALALAAQTAAAQTAAAQTSWPTSPVRLIMPYPPATSGDLISRKVALFLSQKLGASFYVDNRAGANGNIGMKAAMDAAPDGYTFVSASDIQFAVSPALYPNLSYDMDRESGFPGFTSTNIWGVMAPAGTPDPIVMKFRQAIAEALADADIRAWYRTSVLSTLDGGTDEMVRTIREERAMWPQIVKAANIKLTE